MQGESRTDIGFSGERLAQQMGELGLDALKLATVCGIERRTVYSYISGPAKPSAEVLSRMASLGIDIEWILTGRLTTRLFSSPHLVTMRPVAGIVSENREIGTYLLRRAQLFVGHEAQAAGALKVAGLMNVILRCWDVFAYWAMRAEKDRSEIEQLQREGTPAINIASWIARQYGPSTPADPDALTAALLDLARGAP
jgi:transcriptional regulator with XRE-family HTH domain